MANVKSVTTSSIASPVKHSLGFEKSDTFSAKNSILVTNDRSQADFPTVELAIQSVDIFFVLFLGRLVAPKTLAVGWNQLCGATEWRPPRPPLLCCPGTFFT